MKPTTANERLDKMITKGRSQFLKPLMIAEILRLHRTMSVGLDDVKSFKGAGVAAMKTVASELFNRHVDLNWEYIGGAFTDDKMSPAMLRALASLNHSGEIGSYIYRAVEARWRIFRVFMNKWTDVPFEEFSIRRFIQDYESMEGVGNARGKLYEVVVYALFSAVVEAVDAKVEFTLNRNKLPLLNALTGFTEVFFDLPSGQHRYEQPAKIYRAGRTHASDSGIDMWANFGPVIQVKHQSSGSFGPQHAAKIISSVRCDRLVIICRRRNRRKMEELAALLEASDYVRLVDEDQIIQWYDVIMSPPNVANIGRLVHEKLLRELKDEFPIPTERAFDRFCKTRAYRSEQWPED